MGFTITTFKPFTLLRSSSSSSSSPPQAQAAFEVLCEDLPIETIDNDRNDDLDIQITEIEDETVMGSEDMLKRFGGLEVWKVCNYS
ncbi:hypothetical protein L6452_37598 [Arctium lappa]|uniref:Uncharacterized protein n=1 Tax=Arctium lappa TaxID=4217 RepID=A0ACB8Y2R4_ARCLA|nr:hypothetical protein L6452_37598 [Arctium lappa]